MVTCRLGVTVVIGVSAVQTLPTKRVGKSNGKEELLLRMGFSVTNFKFDVVGGPSEIFTPHV